MNRASHSAAGLSKVLEFAAEHRRRGLKDGKELTARDGTKYVLSNSGIGGGTIRRLTPKIHGKAAVKQYRRAIRLRREAAARQPVNDGLTSESSAR